MKVNIRTLISKTQKVLKGTDFVCNVAKVNSNEYITTIMHKEGKACACITIFTDTKDVVLSNLNVHPNYRRNGVGLMLQEIREKISTSVYGISDVWLWCKKNTWQYEWYLRRGYILGHPKDYVTGNVWMSKNL